MWHHSKKIHPSFSCAKVTHLFCMDLSFSVSFPIMSFLLAAYERLNLYLLSIVLESSGNYNVLNYILMFPVLCRPITLLTAELIQNYINDFSKTIAGFTLAKYQSPGSCPAWVLEAAWKLKADSVSYNL